MGDPPKSVLVPPSELNPRREAALDFPWREFGPLSAADYDAIGFLAGLEVHQQLDTKTKLFCRCPSGRYVTRFDAEVLRHMRPTLSELGEYDGTALMEFKKKKEIVYQLERGTVCTYEIDDTPPMEMNRDAVKIAIEIAQLFNLNLVSELHVMRKQYLDGSIPTGFQRTAMIALAGVVPFRDRSLGIDRELHIRQLSLEEDSCREVSDIGHRITFRTDRLGVPLTEVVTEPELLSPFELRAAARTIADVTRATGKVRRGAGAARQDVNVSVAGGRRVEIKGVAHHRGLPRLVHGEAFRQLELLKIRAALLERGVTEAMLDVPADSPVWSRTDRAADVSRLLRRCAFQPIRDARRAGHRVAVVRLPGFAGLLRRPTQPGITFAGEFEDRLRVIACLTGRPFMVHSDIPGFGLRTSEWRHVQHAVGATSEDALVVCWGPPADVETAARELFLRAIEALRGVPAETRQSFPDGTTGFERVLPGPNRMYPDTDTPPLPIPSAWVTDIATSLPVRPLEHEHRYIALGVPRPAAARLAVAPWRSLFNEVAPEGAHAARVAHAFEKRLGRKGEALPSASRVAPLVKALARGTLLLEAFELALAALLAKGVSPRTILARYRPLSIEDPALVAAIDAGVAAARALWRSNAPAAERWAMGVALAPFRGRVEGGAVRARVRQRFAEREEAGRVG